MNLREKLRSSINKLIQKAEAQPRLHNPVTPQRKLWLQIKLTRTSKIAIAFIIVTLITTSIIQYFYPWLTQTKAASVGPRYATATGDCVNDTSASGTVNWTNPGNAFSDNGTNASASVDGTTSEYIKCTNFGFTSGMVPNGSTIDGIVVTVERSSSSTNNGGSQDAAVRIVKGGTIGSTDRSTTTTYTTSMVAEDHGGNTDKWGESWTATDITSSTFGAAFSATKSSSGGAAHTVSVDYISITVYFSAPSWSTITQRQGVITNDQNNSVLSSHTAKIGEKLRVVTQVDTNTGSVPKGVVFALQYDKNDSNWTTLTPTSEIRPVKSSIIDMNPSISTGLAGTCTGGKSVEAGYQFEKTAKSDAVIIEADGCHDIGFVVDTSNASHSTTYRFRLFNLTDNTTLDSYAGYASFTTVSSANDTISSFMDTSPDLESTLNPSLKYMDNQGYQNIASDDDNRQGIIHTGSSINNVVDKTFTGTSGSSLGWAVRSAGDVNGDGYDDVIVGATGVGEAYIYFGGTDMDTTADVTFTGENSGDEFGAYVAGVGDVNGDGYDDVIVGAYAYNSNMGRAYVFLGSDALSGTIAAASANLIMTGEATGNYFAEEANPAGDVNGDGYSDFIIGAYRYSSNTGRAYLYYGGSAVNNTADVVYTGPSASSSFAKSVRYAGDVNGDGYGDVIIGASQINSNDGRAYIFYGSNSLSSSISAASANKTFEGESAVANRFGHAVAGAGDVNGDGYDDVIAGGWGYNSSTGRAYLYLGGADMNTTADVTFTGEATGNNFSYALSGAGDINGDGYDDLMVGAYGYTSSTGRAYIYYGSLSPDNAVDLTVNGEATFNYFAGNLGYAGDVNGDGYDDVIMGSDSYSSSTGRAYILYGGVSSSIPNTTVTRKSSESCTELSEINVNWTGQSSTAPLTHSIVLQVYRFGSTNSWTNIDLDDTSAADTDIALTGSLDTNLAEYCDGSNWSYWRVYQQSGQMTLLTDQFAITFGDGEDPEPTPTPTPTLPPLDKLLRGGKGIIDGIKLPLYTYKE